MARTEGETSKKNGHKRKAFLQQLEPHRTHSLKNAVMWPRIKKIPGFREGAL